MSTKNSLRILCVLLVVCVQLVSMLTPSETAWAATCKSRYTVRLNDTFLKVIRKYKLSPSELIGANNLVGPDYPIYVSQKLCIPASSGSQSVYEIKPYMTHPAGSFNVVFEGEVKFSAANFAPNNGYKVYLTSKNGEEMLTGQFTTNKNGNVNLLLPYPQNFLMSRRIKVCVQDVQASMKICRQVRWH